MLLTKGVLVQSDARAIPFPDSYFHSVITSPPYYGLRQYAGDQGDEPFGMEKTPELYIERLVEVARDVWRVLRPDGVFWLNIGDTYTGGGRGGQSTEKRSENWQPTYTPSYKGMTGGNLLGMPHAVAQALQSDGWILRNDLVWYKRNSLPEPMVGWRWERHRLKIRSADVDWREEARRTDRPLDGPAHVGGGNTGFRHSPEWVECDGCEKCDPNGGYVLRKGSWRHTRAHEFVFQLVKDMQYYCDSEAVKEFNETDSNPRSVIDVPTATYKGAHYATFPTDLIAPLIKASVPNKACPVCGDPYAPVVEREKHPTRDVEAQRRESVEATGRTDGFTMGPSGMVDETRVTGYRPTCAHEGDPIPGIVLDIFGGSGTTGMVAKQLMRRWALMDISRPYLDELAKVRTGTGMPSKALEGLPLFRKETDIDE